MGYSTEEIAGCWTFRRPQSAPGSAGPEKDSKTCWEETTMKKNDYQNLMEHIQPPAGLNDRVLSAARQTAGAQKETTGPKHLAPGKRRRCSGRQYAPPVHWRWW